MSLFSCQREPTGCGRYHLTEHTSVTIVFIFYLLSFILLSLSLSLSFIFYTVIILLLHLQLLEFELLLRVNVANKRNNQLLLLNTHMCIGSPPLA